MNGAGTYQPTDRAYLDGFEAYQAGKPETANHYKEPTLRSAWWQGFKYAWALATAARRSPE